MVSLGNKTNKQTKKKNPIIHCLQKSHFKYKDVDRLKVKKWKKICHATTNQKKAERAILV